MTKRPTFMPSAQHPFFSEVWVEFQWFPGFAITQSQKSIAAWHVAVGERGISPCLEISSKSPNELGVALSAFNLRLTTNDQRSMTVEAAFQGSKVFEHGGPYADLYMAASRDAKSDPRLRSSGSITAFNFLGSIWPTEPKTMFYDWLWQRSLLQGHNEELRRKITAFNAFTDIAFNPEKSLNCQARSAAIFVGLSRAGLLEKTFTKQAAYRRVMLNSALTIDATESTSEDQISLQF